jgi:hypothetical protein
MANVNVNITELQQVLDSTPASHNIMLVGNHGIGKSEILTEYFSKKGMPVVALFLGQMADPGDLIGLPHKNEETGKTEFMPPYWFPVDGKPIVLFLDELNRARPEILQTVMDLCLNRKLAGRRLPEGSRVISAVNAGDQYQLTDLDPALVSRFNILNFRPTVQEWLLWAEKAGVDQRVTGFIREHSEWLDRNPDAKEGADTGLDKTPDRRAWKRVSDIISDVTEMGPVMSKILSSVVGAKAASAFISDISNKKIVSGREVIMDFEKVQKTLKDYQLHQLSVVNDGLYRFLEVEKIPEKDKRKAVKNIEAYFDWLAKEKKEAAAHFANLYTQDTYPEARGFLAKNCSVLVMTMVYYVKSIKMK